jgi:hypothetical protein
LLLVIAGTGCSRNVFRERADRDVEGVLTEKNQFPNWDIKDWHVYPDPRARYADPYNPDRPPYPPDDYAARVLSPNPQHPTKKSGTGRYDGDGYLKMLDQWDQHNRAPLQPQARADGMQPQQQVVQTDVVSWMVLPSSAYKQPVASPVVVSGGGVKAPAAVQPVTRNMTPAAGGSVQNTPPAVRPAVPAKNEVSEWMPARARLSFPNVPTLGKLGRPGVYETRGGNVIPAGGAQPAVPAPGSPGSGAPGSAQATLGWTAAQALPALPSIPLAPAAQAPAATPPAAAIPPAPGTPLPSTTAPQAVPAAPAQPAPAPELNPTVGQQPPVRVIPDAKGPDAKGGPAAETLPRPALISGAGSLPTIEDLLTTGDKPNDYLRALTTNQRGFRLRLDQAVQLGILNAREFQDRREDVYLAALPVTLQRFNLAALGFFTEQAIYNSAGKLAGNTSGWGLNTTGGVSKLFPTGASLMVQLANQVVIDFGNGKPALALSNLGLSLSQPFLQGGGYAVTLEPLTQAERSLLYAMRSYYRFRKIFYVSVVTGGGLTNNPYGLAGLSTNLGRGVGQNLTSPTVGFLALLQSGAIVMNQKKNVETLERFLRQYEAFREGGQLSDLQVGLLEIQLRNSQVTLLGSTGTTGAPGSIRGYLDALDNFKLQLGLPLTVGLDLDTSPLRPIQNQLAKYEGIYADVRQAEAEAHKFDPNDPVATYRVRWRQLLTDSRLVKGTRFSRTIAERWDAWARLTDNELTERLGKVRKMRSDLLDRRTDRQQKGQPEPVEEAREVVRLDGEIDLAFFERTVRTYESQPWLKFPEGPARTSAQAAAFRDMFNAIYQVTLEARNERLTVAHETWPKLPKLPVFGVDMLTSSLDDAYTAGIQGALSSRLDLMNTRAQVVDAWRQVAVAANALQGVLNVTYNMTAASPGNKPFAFAGDMTQHQLTINAQLPLVRRAERNNYRATLINYQRARRLLMAFEDNIANDVRNDIRQLRALNEVYKIQQRIVELAYSTVENASAVLFAPPVPGTVLDAGTAASLTTQLLNAQNNLVNAQNTLFTYWVSYHSERIQTYLDLELMQLDERGIWTDEQIPGIDLPLTPPSDGQPGERLPAPVPVGPADR